MKIRGYDHNTVRVNIGGEDYLSIYTVSLSFRVATLSQQQNSLTEFYFSLTKILCFYGLFLFLQLIHDKFSLSSSPILQFQKKKKMF